MRQECGLPGVCTVGKWKDWVVAVVLVNTVIACIAFYAYIFVEGYLK